MGDDKNEAASSRLSQSGHRPFEAVEMRTRESEKAIRKVAYFVIAERSQCTGRF
jgi:hypothetical protein